MKRKGSYNQRYAGDEYYWGKKPSITSIKVIELVHPTPTFRPKLIDLGCGEGRNAVYFAQRGFDVVALDLSLPGIEKTKRYAKETGVNVTTIHANILEYELKETYDVIFSTGTLHFLPPETRGQHFQNYKDHTSSNGINAISVFVKKPFIPRAPDLDRDAYHFTSGELLSYYWDWEVLYCVEEIFECASGGVSHKHAVNRIIARRYRTE
ncbi:MAG: methyltransferase domain-containing protein [candidate division WOR-3 bacterium]|nr:MAG: methyltransferase domain-containing protein [candidate division WOR-3 bacterium]